MPLPLLAAAKVGSQLAPLLLGLGRKKKKGPNVAALAADYRSRRPEMTLSAEDLAAGARTRAGVNASAVRSGELTRMGINRQVAARGLSGPAAAALGLTADAQVAEGREKGALAEAEQLYQTGRSNQEYDRSKEDRIFGGLLGNAHIEAQRNDARDATFWNSMMDLSTATSSLWGGGATGASGAINTRRPIDSPLSPDSGAPSTITEIPHA